MKNVSEDVNQLRTSSTIVAALAMLVTSFEAGLSRGFHLMDPYDINANPFAGIQYVIVLFFLFCYLLGLGFFRHPVASLIRLIFLAFVGYQHTQIFRLHGLLADEGPPYSTLFSQLFLIDVFVWAIVAILAGAEIFKLYASRLDKTNNALPRDSI